MERVCIACGGSGLAQHVDRTLPPPPCRLCHPEEAALHMALARETRAVATAWRRDAYQMVRAAIVPDDILPRQRHSPSDGRVESPSAPRIRLVAFGGPVPEATRLGESDGRREPEAALSPAALLFPTESRQSVALDLVPGPL